jgi:serine/threonine-protein kinase
MSVLRCRACGNEYEPSLTGQLAEQPCPRCGERPGTDRYQPNSEQKPGSDGEAEQALIGPDGKPLPKKTDRGQDPSTGSVIAGYKLEKRVGDGATSAVYKAIDPANLEPVAVKVLSADQSGDHEAIERFSREARLARRIKHPNLVRVHGSGVDDHTGTHYLVMDLVEGVTLEALVAKQGRLPWRQALEFVFQVAQAVDALRRHGCVHRDIKPANILVADGVAKLTDLGFVKPISEAPNDRDALIMGTPAYMAPEQAIDAREATHAADVYALGATLFHALTGKAPFSGADGDAIMQSVLRDPTPSARELVPELPESIDLLVRWAMAKDPAKRPPDASTFSRAIENILGNPENTGTIKRARRRVELPLMHMLLVALVAAAMGALLVLLIVKH